MKPVIEVHNISKKYRIGIKQPYYSLRDTITDLIKKPLTWKTRNTNRNNNEIWALKDVSFQVMPGEVLGIIGRNGAGKTTLLKILSQITPPTQGKIILRGRVASLLEVGTGFHPELSGRENIFLNGAILGMTRKEVKDKFDEIVDFAEIEKFLDTTVKHYSSGMYMRLAFAVAAHLEPEILLVDEVLAVGDIQFQKKCLGKMSTVSKEGRTVLFVSHNMGMIENLCDKSILMDNGRMIFRGHTKNVVNEYLKRTINVKKIKLNKRKDRTGTGVVRVVELNISDSNGNIAIQSFEKLKIIVKFEKNLRKFPNIQLILGFYDFNFRGLFRVDSGLIRTNMIKNDVLEISTSEINLVPQNCTVNMALFVDGKLSDYIMDICNFEILAPNKHDLKLFPPDLSTILISTRINYVKN